MIKSLTEVLLNVSNWLFYHSPWGIALALLIWKCYKKTPLFEQRKSERGELFAAKTFKYTEYKVIKNKILHNRKLLSLILFRPHNLIKKLGNEDIELRKKINFLK